MIMYFVKRFLFLFLHTLLQFLLLRCGTSQDTITVSQPVTDGKVLVSHGKIFALGFFSPGMSTHRYVGIWYYSADPGQAKVYVWVANRDNPINNRSGVLSIDVHGNLVLSVKDQSQHIWSADIVSKSKNNISTIAQLLDSGNLILTHDDERKMALWQSFDHPTDTSLPNMKIGLDRRTGLNRVLTSWKSKDDPGTGNFSYKIDSNGSPQLFLYEGKVPRWRSGHWNGHGWSGIPTLQDSKLFNISFVDNESEITTIWGVGDRPTLLSTLVVNESGFVQRSVYMEGDSKWDMLGAAPFDQCDIYGKCGAFGKCNKVGSGFECSCLPGLQRNASGGCVRKRGAASICRSGEGFVKVANVKVPDTSAARVKTGLSMEACKELCLQNCSCTAYASVDAREEAGDCINWNGVLIDTRLYGGGGGQSLYVRVDAVELDLYHSRKPAAGFFASKKRLAITVVAMLVTSFLIFVFVLSVIKRKRERKGSANQPMLFDDASSIPFQDSQKHDERRGKPDLPFFELSTVVAATDNFSPANRLGQGGFGPVYKGQLTNGQEIAVKTLSKSSRQGTEEFKNEVMLIAKLQHRNLVRLFGCSIHKEERMLIYEYMPNKSLDFFIFDEIKRQLLDWRKRFEIIVGIARGVLYLHQDSRLKIIHRDLKASNVLLDAAMNPKISDFGLARMFGDDQIEANTNRPVGTYGYMSPEYAMEGLYSTKSDVFSYGVLALEIISGKRNNHFYVGSPCLNLIGHAWDLWKEGKALDIVDSSLGDEASYPAYEVLRCIQIGLLCVQEQAADRPTMLEVVFMLGNEANVSSPNKPAFINRRIIDSGQDPSSSAAAAASQNDITISELEAR
ncbi:G-type lectin S-receptor-like serine/threonine-protein kinase At1g11410 [Juglans microcarpa x Juglans regia]|uniref:G-type lectin S-receptor-like serine/threonine-protein kinase At1g11410 n=1 Tax=Juglans microcarpa x Juglans regia TaxID=2249226 RepID=UPI001B7F6ED5|nr:G-type lectin S-receptor-like serine/threonine-protein kinase At1g11410 [Juglans microcarpa x Juglans regia]